MADGNSKWLDINVSAPTHDALKSLGQQVGLSATGTAKALILNALLEKALGMPQPVELKAADAMPEPNVSRETSTGPATEDERWKMMVDSYGGPQSDMLPAARRVQRQPDGKVERIYHADDFPWQQLPPPHNTRPKKLVQLTVRS